MTEQKAIEEFNLLKKTRMFIPRNDTLDIAINALEKQIPKEPNEVYGKDVIDWTCGRCGRFHRNDCKLKYCSECGQAIKWE